MFGFFPKTTHHCVIFKLVQIFILLLMLTGLGWGQYRFDQWTADTGLPQNSVYDLKQTRDGYLWLATVDGLARFDGARFTIFNTSNTSAIVNNRFVSLFEDPQGDLWAGTEESGAVRLRNGLFSTFGVDSGLRRENIFFSLQDEQGNPTILYNSDFKSFRFDGEKFSPYELLPVTKESFSEGKTKTINCIFNKENIFTCDLGGSLSNLKIWDPGSLSGNRTDR